MKKTIFAFIAAMLVVPCFAQLDSSNLNSVFGKKGMVSGNVYKVAFPRTDLNVKVRDFKVAPGFALGSWVGIIQTGNNAMMMGDLVLLDIEVPKVINKLVQEGLQITAIHNHLINEKPAIKYIHYHGEGNAVDLARKIKAVLEVTGTPLKAPSQNAKPMNVDWSKVTDVLGTNGKKSGEILQYSFPRNEKLTVGGMEMPPSMGMATGINFQMEGNRAAITGDFVLVADEVNPVVKALTQNGITPTAIHNHMLNDNPHLFMMHFWAVGDPGKLANGLKEALEKTNIRR
ncbi:MAG TPA: DUF1259 domain-containing protein [Hanamia sp.]|nr:DUF1259 domain-containing protein [Hanamia sp.]